MWLSSSIVPHVSDLFGQPLEVCGNISMHRRYSGTKKNYRAFRKKEKIRMPAEQISSRHARKLSAKLKAHLQRVRIVLRLQTGKSQLHEHTWIS